VEGAQPPSQEPPGGWQAQPAPAYPPEAYAVKRGLGRAWGFSLASFGVWGYWWFYVHRKLIDGEKGEGRDDAVLHTVGLFVPILNFFVLYWLWRDISQLRARVGLSDFSAGAYLVGAVFLAPVMYSIVLVKLNEYWDARTQGLATEAPVTTGEKVAIAIGAALLVLWLLFVVLLIVVGIATSGSSS
jgi:hypothetical protein